MRFEGKTAIITGGAGMLGADIAKRLAAEGAKVAIVDIREDRINQVVSEICSVGQVAAGYTVNIKNSKEVNRAVEAVKERFGSVDILISSAGGSARDKMTTLVDQTDEVLEDIIGVNLFGALYFARACGRYMVEQQRGTILTVASISGVNGNYRQVDYAAAKGGVIGATKALAKELGKYGITVNCVSPGIIPHDDKDYSATNYLSRNCTTEEITNVALFLVSDEASFVTGQNYIVDGGRSIALRGSY